jgi:hypothetical protein
MMRDPTADAITLKYVELRRHEMPLAVFNVR